MLTQGSPQGHPSSTPGSPQVHPRSTSGPPQVHPRFTPGSPRLGVKLKYDVLLSRYAFKYKLRRYRWAAVAEESADEVVARLAAACRGQVGRIGPGGKAREVTQENDPTDANPKP